MKVEIIKEGDFVSSYLVDNRYIVSHLYIADTTGTRGDVKIFDTEKTKEVEGEKK